MGKFIRRIQVSQSVEPLLEELRINTDQLTHQLLFLEIVHTLPLITEPATRHARHKYPLKSDLVGGTSLVTKDLWYRNLSVVTDILDSSHLAHGLRSWVNGYS